eukprot:2358248-Amphidinium_carterae.1
MPTSISPLARGWRCFLDEKKKTKLCSRDRVVCTFSGKHRKFRFGKCPVGRIGKGGTTCRYLDDPLVCHAAHARTSKVA